MFYNTGSDHIQVYVYQTLNQVIIAFHCCCMVAILPKGAFPMFSLIIFLPCPSCYKLKGFWDCISTSIIEEEKVYVV